MHCLDAQTKSSSLGTCKQIKKLCPEVKSGYFWLRDATNRLNINNFYCDMETDSGEVTKFSVLIFYGSFHFCRFFLFFRIGINLIVTTHETFANGSINFTD